MILCPALTAEQTPQYPICQHCHYYMTLSPNYIHVIIMLRHTLMCVSAQLMIIAVSSTFYTTTATVQALKLVPPKLGTFEQNWLMLSK